MTLDCFCLCYSWIFMLKDFVEIFSLFLWILSLNSFCRSPSHLNNLSIKWFSCCLFYYSALFKIISSNVFTDFCRITFLAAMLSTKWHFTIYHCCFNFVCTFGDHLSIWITLKACMVYGVLMVLWWSQKQYCTCTHLTDIHARLVSSTCSFLLSLSLCQVLLKMDMVESVRREIRFWKVLKQRS